MKPSDKNRFLTQLPSLALWILAAMVLISVNAYGQKKKSKDDLTPQQRMQFDRTFYDAAREKMLGNNDKALELYLECIKADPKNAASHYEAASILNSSRKYNEALSMAERAYELDDSNQWYAMLMADVLSNTGNLEGAIKIYNELIQKNPAQLEIYELLANTYLLSNKPQDAIDTYNALEKQVGVDAMLINEKKRIYLKMGKTEAAAAEIEKLIQADPSLFNYSMLVEIYQVYGLHDKAYEVIQKMVAIDDASALTCFSYAEYYRAKGEKEKAFEQLKRAFRADDATAELKMQVLSSYIPLVRVSSELKMQALELAQILTETEPGFSTGHVLYGDFLYQDEQYEEARSEYRLGVKTEQANFVLRSQLLDCSLKLNDLESLEKESEEAIELFPNQPVVFLYNGIAKMQLKKHEQAIKPLVTGSKMVINNDPLAMNFYSALGECYHYTENYNESDKYFEKALKIDPRNTVNLNNYAYYLSLRGQMLEKAETMSKLSNELSPDNGTYQDTYAWVLYKMKRYNDAREWMEKALKNGGDKSGTVVEHYGDILFMLDNVNGAVEQWQKAKQLGEGSETLDKKISEKKLLN